MLEVLKARLEYIGAIGVISKDEGLAVSAFTSRGLRRGLYMDRGKWSLGDPDRNELFRLSLLSVEMEPPGTAKNFRSPEP